MNLREKVGVILLSFGAASTVSGNHVIFGAIILLIGVLALGLGKEEDK